MTYVIRREEWRDYPGIAELHAETFDYAAGMGEVVLVDALRRRTAHIPELSFVAEAAEGIIGHAFFSLYEARLGGEPVRASLLGPVAVRSAWRGIGVGSALVEEGHRFLTGYRVHLGLVLGHPGYYARFGYAPRAFGAAGVRVRTKSASAPGVRLIERRPTAADVNTLLRMWDRWHNAVDLALRPEASLTDWLSPDARFRGIMLESDGEAIGYARLRGDRPHAPAMLLAEDEEGMISCIAHLASMTEEPELVLPIHPSVAPAGIDFEPFADVWEAGMLRAFPPPSDAGKAEQDVFAAAEAYAEAVIGGRVPPGMPGMPLWPPAFDVC